MNPLRHNVSIQIGNSENAFDPTNVQNEVWGKILESADEETISRMACVCKFFKQECGVITSQAQEARMLKLKAQPRGNINDIRLSSAASTFSWNGKNGTELKPETIVNLKGLRGFILQSVGTADYKMIREPHLMTIVKENKSSLELFVLEGISGLSTQGIITILGELKEVREIGLKSSKITRAVIETLAEMPHLEEITLSGFQTELTRRVVTLNGSKTPTSDALSSAVDIAALKARLPNTTINTDELAFAS